MESGRRSSAVGGPGPWTGGTSIRGNAGQSTRILGFAALISVSGCGSESSRPPAPPLAASPDRVPPAAPPASLPDDPPVRLAEIAPDPPARPQVHFQFDEPLRAPAVATGDPELDPLVFFLKASYAEEIKDGHRLVLVAIFYVGNLRHLLNGMGGLRVFKKEGDVWVDQQINIGPSWST